MNTTTNTLTVTVDDVLSWEPCWGEHGVREAMASKQRWTARDFVDLYRAGKLNASEFLWVVLREELIPENTLHLLACDFAETALLRERAAGREPHPDSWKAIEVKRAWIQGRATDEELLKTEETADATAVRAKNLAVELAQASEWSAEKSAWAAVFRAADASAWAACSTARAAIRTARAAAESAADSAESAAEPATLASRAIANLAALNAVKAEQAARVIEVI